jgi:hypothetical protein
MLTTQVAMEVKPEPLITSMDAPPACHDHDDLITPFHFMDDQPTYRLGVVLLSFRFNAVLDTGKMRDALRRVYELEGWRKLGARIRLNVRSCCVLRCSTIG